jgi:hypothetical protein
MRLWSRIPNYRKYPSSKGAIPSKKGFDRRKLPGKEANPGQERKSALEYEMQTGRTA